MKLSKKKKRQQYEDSKQKVLVLEAQVQAMIAGELNEFRCPFCETTTEVGQMLCCEPCGDVVTAIMDHIEFKQGAELVNQVMDRFMEAQSKRVTLN